MKKLLLVILLLLIVPITQAQDVPSKFEEESSSIPPKALIVPNSTYKDTPSESSDVTTGLKEKKGKKHKVQDTPSESVEESHIPPKALIVPNSTYNDTPSESPDATTGLKEKKGEKYKKKHMQAQDTPSKSVEESYKQLLDLQKKQLEDTTKGVQDTALQTEIKRLRKVLCDQKQHKLFVSNFFDKKTDLAQLVSDCSKSELLAILGKKNNDGKLDQITQAYLIPIGDPEKYMAMLFNDKGQPEKIQLSDNTEINFTNYTTKSTDSISSKQSENQSTNNIKADVEVKYPNGQTKTIKNHDLGMDNKKFSDATKFISGKKHDDDYYGGNSCLDKEGMKDEQCQPPSPTKAALTLISDISCGVSMSAGIVAAPETAGLSLILPIMGCSSALADAINFMQELACKKPLVGLQTYSDKVGRASTASGCALTAAGMILGKKDIVGIAGCFADTGIYAAGQNAEAIDKLSEKNKKIEAPKPAEDISDEMQKNGKDDKSKCIFDCVKVYKTEVQKTNCISPGWMIHFVNTCPMTVDVQTCMRNKTYSSGWDCGLKLYLKPSERANYYTCQYAGEYRILARDSADVMTKFPPLPNK